jgi:hypothetical protein
MLMICWTPTQTDWLIECSSSPSGWWRWWIRVLSFRFLCVSSERVLKVGRIPYRLDNWDVSPRESVEGSALITNTGLPRSSGPPLPTNQHLHSSLKSSSSSSLSHLFTSFLRMRTNSFYDHLILHRHPQSASNYQSQPSRDCPLILLKSPIYTSTKIHFDTPWCCVQPMPENMHREKKKWIRSFLIRSHSHETKILNLNYLHSERD